MRNVVVVEHDPRWTQMFREESRRVASALGANAVDVHHIGSTAIPSIHAKPIIDLLVEVASLAGVDDDTPRMEELGYEALGEFGIAGRRYFRKDDGAGVRSHQVHAFAAGSAQVVRHLSFRDFLRAHPTWAQCYSDLKRQLAAAHPHDADAYMDGKDAFIQDIDRRAAAWLADSNATADRHEPKPCAAEDSSVRRVDTGDVDLVRDVRLRALADAPDDFDIAWEEQLAWSHEQWKRWIAERATFVLEREADGRGLVIGEPHRTDGRAAYLGAMWIDPALRGTGAADGLVAAVVAWARADGRAELWLDVEEGNGRARRFYERHGFRATGRVAPRERDGRSEVEMKLDLRRSGDEPHPE